MFQPQSISLAFLSNGGLPCQVLLATMGWHPKVERGREGEMPLFGRQWLGSAKELRRCYNKECRVDALILGADTQLFWRMQNSGSHKSCLWGKTSPEGSAVAQGLPWTDLTIYLLSPVFGRRAALRLEPIMISPLSGVLKGWLPVFDEALGSGSSS